MGFLSPKAPSLPPPPPPPPSRDDTDDVARAASEERRRRRVARERANDILTSGLGVPEAAPAVRKILLGE